MFKIKSPSIKLNEELLSRMNDTLSAGVVLFEEPEIPSLDSVKTTDFDSDEGIDSLIATVKNMEEVMNIIKIRENELANIRKDLENVSKQATSILEEVLDGDTFSSEYHTVKYRSSEQCVIEDEKMIPEEYWKVSAPTIDKANIKKALKNGTDVPGAKLLTKSNIQIS